MRDKFNPVPHDHAKLMEIVNANPEAKEAYERAQYEFALIDAMREAAKRSGLTQQEIAERMGSTQSSVSRMLKSDRAPNWKTAVRFFGATGATVKKIQLSFP